MFTSFSVFKTRRKTTSTSSKVISKEITRGQYKPNSAPTTIDCATQDCSRISAPLAFGIEASAIATAIATAWETVPGLAFGALEARVNLLNDSFRLKLSGGRDRCRGAWAVALAGGGGGLAYGAGREELATAALACAGPRDCALTSVSRSFITMDTERMPEEPPRKASSKN